jgi:hypothetical protein
MCDFGKPLRCICVSNRKDTTSTDKALPAKAGCPQSKGGASSPELVVLLPELLLLLLLSPDVQDAVIVYKYYTIVYNSIQLHGDELSRKDVADSDGDILGDGEE